MGYEDLMGNVLRWFKTYLLEKDTESQPDVLILNRSICEQFTLQKARFQRSILA